MARSRLTHTAQTTAQTAVQCAGCDRTCTTATGLWYCPPCTTMYWDGVNAGHAYALAAQPPLPPPSPAVTAVVNAVVIPAKKAGRKRTPFCCHVSGCKQAEKEYDFKSSFHLKAHNKAAHETPRLARAPAAGTCSSHTAGSNRISRSSWIVRTENSFSPPPGSPQSLMHRPTRRRQRKKKQFTSESTF